LFLSVCVSISFAVICWIFINGAFEHFTFNLYSVYDYRKELGDIVFVGLFAYLVDWTGRAFNVVILIWSLQRRNWAFALIAIVLEVLLYGGTLNKSFLFNIPFVALVFFSIHRWRNGVAGVGWLIALLIIVGMLETMILDEANITAVITRRVLAIPAYVANEYYDFFGNNGHVYWTNGFLGALSQYPFAYDPPRLIGEVAFGHRDSWANNGMFGNGFMHAGFVGMLGYGVVYGLWLYTIDCIAVGRVPLASAVSVVVLSTTSVVTDSDLTTGLLTHGGAAATVMLWLWAGTVQPPTEHLRRP
jgi:hypothetical protein